LRGALGAPCTTQQLFSLSAGRQIMSQVAIIAGLLSQTILE
jgi:hypothetical protein